MKSFLLEKSPPLSFRVGEGGRQKGYSTYCNSLALVMFFDHLHDKSGVSISSLKAFNQLENILPQNKDTSRFYKKSLFKSAYSLEFVIQNF